MIKINSDKNCRLTIPSLSGSYCKVINRLTFQRSSACKVFRIVNFEFDISSNMFIVQSSSVIRTLVFGKRVEEETVVKEIRGYSTASGSIKIKV